MRKKQLLCLSLAFMCAAGLTACGSTAPEATTGVVIEQSETTAAVEEDTTEATTAEEKKEETDGPVIEADFETETPIAEARGPVTLTYVDGGMDGSKALEISGRTDAWNGVNFNCDAYRGNKIRVNVNAKSKGKSVRLSIQYDVDGITSYNWITSGSTTPDAMAFITGTYDVPADVENIFVYVESDTTDDITIDDLKIMAEGKYVEPKAIEKKEMADISGYESMKDIYADDFKIGVCINPAVVENPDYSALIKQQFNSVTCENNMKPESILDKAGSLEDLTDGGTHLKVDMSACEAELQFAIDNGMQVRGHTLVWHSQTPDWIFYVDYDTSKELADRDLMLTRLDNYLNDVFTWAKENHDGLFYAWDVVNEAMEDNGKMRDSLWYQTIGEDYLEQVYAIARKYAPEGVKLFYNDYNAYQSTKQNAIIEALRPVAEAGNLDGVGMQGHLYTGEDPEHFAKCAKRYADELGVVVHITEIDVEQPSGGNPEGDQGKYYGNLFKALKDAKANGVPIESVSIWGLTDSLSWKAGNKPLLFNGDLTGKLAFYQIIQEGKKAE